MSCARALSLLKLGSLRQQVGLACLVAVLEVAGFPLLRVAGVLFRVEFARLVGVITVVTTTLLAATSVCGRR